MSNLVFSVERPTIEFEIKAEDKIYKCKWQEMSPATMKKFLNLATDPEKLVDGITEVLNSNLIVENADKQEVINTLLNDMGATELFAMVEKLNEAIGKLRDEKVKK